MEVISRVDMSAMSEPLISPSASLLAVKMKEKPSKHDAPLCFAYQNCQLFLMSVNGNAIALEGRWRVQTLSQSSFDDARENSAEMENIFVA
jgi:hypothetical protein